MTSCAGGQLPGLSGECAACECTACDSFSYNCTACGVGLVLHQWDCIATCPDGYHSDSSSCVACTANCSYCASTTLCTICALPNALSTTNSTHSECVSSCPGGTIATIDSTNLRYICSACDAACLTCEVSVTYCTSCSGTYLFEGSCVSVCPSGYHLIAGACRICAVECQACQNNDPSNCTACEGGYFRTGTVCAATCTGATFPNTLTGECTACDPLCLTCSNATNCSSCVATHFLYNAYCYSDCSAINAALYSYSGQCLLCQSMCATCLSNPYNCSACSHSMYYFNPADNSCSTACATGYYHNASECLPCQSPCASCDHSASACLTCTSGLVAFSGSCLGTCPDGYYDSNGSCLACASTCRTCTATHCLLCQPYAYQHRVTCVLDCAVTDLPITIDNYCTSCTELANCQSCEAGSSGASSCFLCVTPYVIFNGNCLDECPTNYVPDSTGNNCVESEAYLAEQAAEEERNKPKVPPFVFLGGYLLVLPLLYFINNRLYPYVYHFGYFLAIHALFDVVLLLYGALSVNQLY